MQAQHSTVGAKQWARTSLQIRSSWNTWLENLSRKQITMLFGGIEYMQDCTGMKTLKWPWMTLKWPWKTSWSDFEFSVSACMDVWEVFLSRSMLHHTPLHLLCMLTCVRGCDGYSVFTFTCASVCAALFPGIARAPPTRCRQRGAFLHLSLYNLQVVSSSITLHSN